MRLTTPLFLALPLVLSLSACGDDPCPPGKRRVGVACVDLSEFGSDAGLGMDASPSPDGGAPDASVGIDAGASADGGHAADSMVDSSATEVCNGIDDDMDGETDEADPMLGEACGDVIGVCTTGNTVCLGGELVCDGVQASEETCNNLDDDCDGEIDENSLQEFYLDVDGDGFGSGDACIACAPEECGEEMWVTMAGDCDETCDTCFLGGTEVCDGADNNCDSLIDENVQSMLSPDTDGDAYGTGLGTPGCADADGNAPSGSALEGGDCGPDDPRAHPHAEGAYSAPMSGAVPAGLPFDFDCDGEETLAYERCVQTANSAAPVCRPAPSFCWGTLGPVARRCGDAVFRWPVTGTTAIPGVSDGVCRFSAEDYSGYDLECS